MLLTQGKTLLFSRRHGAEEENGEEDEVENHADEEDHEQRPVPLVHVPELRILDSKWAGKG